MRRLALTTGLALALAAAAPPGARAELPREIVVTGEGRVEVTPDMATVSAGVETRADTAAEALAENADAMRAVLAALEAAGIDRADIQTSQLALDPVYRQRQGEDWTAEVIAYIARNLVTVRVRDVGAVGRVIDDMSAAGLNRIGGIVFGLADPRPVLDRARQAAIGDGSARAALYARAAGVELGEVLAIRETQPFDQPFPRAMRAEMAMDGAIAEGAIEITAMVEIVYALETAGEAGDDAGEDDASEGDGGTE